MVIDEHKSGGGSMRLQKLSRFPGKTMTFFENLRCCHSRASPPYSCAPPSPAAFHLLLASRTPDLRSLRRHHALLIAAGHSDNPFFAAKLISLYSDFGRLDLADRVFAVSAASNRRDTFLWNSLIKCHFSNGNYPLALRLYAEMRSSGSPSNEFTIPMVVSASAELVDVDIGSCIHSSTTKVGLLPENSVVVGSSLVYMYAKCGELRDAFCVFDEMTVKDEVSWTALIVGCVRNEEYEMGLVCLEMHLAGEDRGGWLNSRAMEAGLQACGSIGALRKGKCLHGVLLKAGIEHDQSIKSSLLSMYSRCESLEDVVVVFRQLSKRDVISWTEIVGVYARKGCIKACLELFKEMEGSGVEPDGVLISCILAGFVKAGSIYGGKAFHAVILRRNYGSDKLVGNALISMYCKFEQLDLARNVFNTMLDLDAKSWNLLAFGYGEVGFVDKCLDIFREMQFQGLDSDPNSLVSVVSSCSQVGALFLGQSVHCYIVKTAFEGDVSIANALVGMYGRCGRLDLSRKVFDRTNRDLVTWNSMLAASAQLGHSDDALTLFRQMLLEDVLPDSTSLICVLSACSHISALHLGKWIHNYIIEMKLDGDISLCTALVDMYAKCGQLEISRSIFASIPNKDVVSWNVMIAGYGIHGYAKEALGIFTEMKKTGLSPNSVTFLAVLSACSHAGLVEEGKQIFDEMNTYSISPTVKHYACMVDLLGRSGNLFEAEAMVLEMPIEPDHGIWGALLGACKIQNNVEMGERIAKRACSMDPENDGYYILMSNMYGNVGRWKEVDILRGLMKNKGVRKRVGWSSVELDSMIHVFTVGDISHIDSDKIYTVLEALYRQMDGLSIM